MSQPIVIFITVLAAMTLCACAELSQLPLPGTQGPAQTNQMALTRAIKESLELGSTRAADLLSRPRGYLDHPAYRIRLPETMQAMAGRLRQFGLGDELDRIELLMNQAAEQAAPEAKAIFLDAVRAMTIADAVGIVRGHDTAATDYFREHTESSLRQRYLPIVRKHLEQIGFYAQYQQVLTAYQRIPIGDKPDLDLEQHVISRSLDGLFRQVAEEEKLIRQDPLGRGNRAIAAVFGR